MLASITLFVCTHKAFLTKHNSTFDLLRNFNLLLGNQVRPSTTHWRKVFQRFRQAGSAQHGVVSHWSIDEANFPNTFEVMVMLLQRHSH